MILCPLVSSLDFLFSVCVCRNSTWRRWWWTMRIYNMCKVLFLDHVQDLRCTSGLFSVFNHSNKTNILWWIIALSLWPMFKFTYLIFAHWLAFHGEMHSMIARLWLSVTVYCKHKIEWFCFEWCQMLNKLKFWKYDFCLSTFHQLCFDLPNHKFSVAPLVELEPAFSNRLTWL